MNVSMFTHDTRTLIRFGCMVKIEDNEKSCQLQMDIILIFAIREKYCVRRERKLWKENAE